MKTLYLVRHAKAIPAGAGVTDFKRALSKTGKKDARAMSRRLRKKSIVPKLFISSPADRALETAHIFAKALGYSPQKILLEDEIYDDGEETLKEIITGIDNEYNTVMLFGHNPSLSKLANDLLQDFGADIQGSGVVGIAFDVSSWQDVSAESATLLLFDFPVRATPEAYKKAKQVIRKKITSTIEDILENIDVGVSKHLEKTVRKTSKKLAKELLKVLQASKVEEISGVRKFARVDNLATKDLQTAVMSPSVAEQAKDTIGIKDREDVEESAQEAAEPEVTEEKVEEPTQETPVAEATEENAETPKQEAPVAEISKKEAETPKQEAPVAEVSKKEVETPKQKAPVAKRSRKTSSSGRKTAKTKPRRSRRRTQRKTPDKKEH